MIYKRKRIVVALWRQRTWKYTSRTDDSSKIYCMALCTFIEEGHQVVVVHGNGPSTGRINNAMTALTTVKTSAQPNTSKPLLHKWL